MELVPILRSLWRRRVLVLLAAVAAIALGVIATGGETTRSGIASARVVLDTEKSQLVYRAPSGHDTLPWRAVLLADLLADRPERERIAAEVGIRTDELVVVHPPLTVPVVPSALPASAAKVAKVTPEEYVLTVRVDELAPVISIEATAPSRRAAANLAEAASQTLRDNGTPAEVTRGIQPLAAESVGPVQSREIVTKPKLLLGVGLALFFFGVCCAAVALGPRLGDVWRGAVGRPTPA